MRILLLVGAIACCQASVLSAAEKPFTLSLDGNYFYSAPNEKSILNPGNVLGLERGTFSLEPEVAATYDVKPVTMYLDLRYYYNPPFPVDGERAYPNKDNIIFLDETKMRWNIQDSASLTVGRQKFFWGPGFIKNPINVVNPPTDFRYPYFRIEEKSGVTGIAGSLYSERTTITGAFIQYSGFERYSQAYVLGQTQPETSIAALKMDATFLTTDFSVLFALPEGEMPETPQFGTTFSKIINDVEIHGEALLQEGSQRHYVNLSTSPATIEKTFEHSGRLFGQYLVGLRYRSSSGIDCLLEYYRNDNGYNGEETNEFIEYIKHPLINPGAVATGNMLFWETTLRRNYLFFRVAFPKVVSRLSLELLSVLNLDDNSLLTGTELKYRFSEKVEAYAGVRTLHGSVNSEFGMIPSSYSISSGIKMFLF